MKKILAIHSSEKISGGERVSLDILNELSKKFIFFIFIPNTRKKSFLQIKNAIYQKRPGLINRLYSLRRAIKKINPEIIHAHGTRAAMLVKIILTTIRHRPKFIYTVHGFHLIHQKKIITKIILWIEKLTNRIFVNTIAAVGLDDYLILKKFHSSQQKIILIKNSLKSPKFKKNELIEDIVYNKERINILTITRLHYQKDIKTAIRAMTKLEDNYHLTIIGDGPERRDVINLINSLKLNNKISLLGNINGASSFLHYYDIFILSTHWEGLPLVILEAMKSRVPVVSSNVHGVKELINNYKDGILFTEGDDGSLAENIKLLSRDEKLKKLIVDNAFSKVNSGYKLEKMIDEYKKLYETI